MLRRSGGARIEAPRQGGRPVGPFTSLTAVSLLALVGATAVAPAQAADPNGKVSTIQKEEVLHVAMARLSLKFGDEGAGAPLLK
jgi:hypothetical protein